MYTGNTNVFFEPVDGANDVEVVEISDSLNGHTENSVVGILFSGGKSVMFIPAETVRKIHSIRLEGMPIGVFEMGGLCMSPCAINAIKKIPRSIFS